MSVQTGAARLVRGMKQLREKWEESEDHWRDSVREDFEERHIEPLAALVQSALREMEKLGSIIEQAQRECEE